VHVSPPPRVGLFLFNNILLVTCKFPVYETSDHLFRFCADKVAAFVAGVELIAKSYS